MLYYASYFPMECFFLQIYRSIFMPLLSFVRKLKSLFRSPYIKYRLNEEAAFGFLKMTSQNYVKLPSQKVKNSLTFYALGDFGAPTCELKATANAMNKWAATNGPPDVILGLGDNFYKLGVTDVSDPQFQQCWSDVFLKHEHLRVPWRMILGNHDYMGSPQAQIDFTTDKRNTGGFWQLPNTCYEFAYNVETADDTDVEHNVVTANPSITSPIVSQSQTVTNDTSTHTTNIEHTTPAHTTFNFNIEFFGLDTNGCQKHVARVFPTSPETLINNISRLNTSLTQSASTWRIVFGHHPCYSQGRAHGRTGECLRQSNPEGKFSVFSSANIKMPVGFGLEEVLQRGADAYFCAHEHVFQHHEAGGVHHFMCGASGAELRHGSGLYDGPHDDMALQWVGSGQDYGFVACTVTHNNMRVQFVSAHGHVLREVNVSKKIR